MRRAAVAALAAGLLLLAATWGGGLHPAGDSLAVGRPFLAALLVIGGLVLRGRAGWVATLAGLLALAPILWTMRPVPVPAGQDLIVYQKNLLHSVDDPAGIAADILQSGADLALLQEVSRSNGGIAAALAGALPHQVICPARAPGTVAVLSRWPFAETPDCATAVGMAAVRVETPAGPLTAVSLHLTWPWPLDQSEQVDALLPRLAALPPPLVIGGDFNAVPWSRTVGRIARATETLRVGPVRPSFRLGGLPLTIDHVLAPPEWSAAARMRPPLGSDHLGQVVARRAEGL